MSNIGRWQEAWYIQRAPNFSRGAGRSEERQFCLQVEHPLRLCIGRRQWLCSCQSAEAGHQTLSVLGFCQAVELH